uniref:AfsR/SARP family transcriptional regulator n=1 Tax=Streptomyces shenzhenensis TaxID=943815 RepID=UPI0015F0C494
MGGVMRRYELRFGLLGPPVLYDAAGVHPIGSPKVRALLAALLLEAGRVVSVESLREALWGGAPPVSARASLHNHVTRLRRLLDDPERLRAVPPGYLLRVDDGELDVDVFDARVAQARAAHGRREWAPVLHACADALALWRGSPLGGLPAELGGFAFVQRLEEARLLVLEWRYDAELALGGPRLDGVVPELAALVAEHPLREAYHRQLMLALHRTGRQAEALAVHRDLRNRLREELGIEPGPAVRRAHVEVLRGRGAAAGERAPHEGASGVEADAGAGVSWLGARVPAPPGGASAPSQPNAGGAGERVESARAATATPVNPVSTRDDSAQPHPAQLPPYPAHFTGRTATREELTHTLTPPHGKPRPPAPADGDCAPQGPPALAGEAATRGAAPASAAADGDLALQGPPAPDREAVMGGAGGNTGAEGEAEATAPVLVVVSGTAGVGKSALALHVAHQLRDRFPDGQLYVHLHGATPGVPPLTPGQALAALLRDLGADPRHIPEHPDAASALLRSLLAPTRTLLLLDDAASAAQVRPLLPGGPGCAVIVTSRSPLTALDGARRVRVGLPDGH